jgi:WD40 repeat protein
VPPPVAIAGPAGVSLYTPWDVGETVAPSSEPSAFPPLVALTDAPARSVVFSPDASTVWAGFDDGSILAWDRWLGGEPDYAFQAPGGEMVTSLSVSKDELLVLAAHGPRASVWSIADGSRLFTVEADSDRFLAFAAAFAPDGATFATGSADGFVRFWDAATGEQIGREVKASAGFVLSLDYRPDGRTLLTGGSDGTARLIDVESQAEIGVPLPATANIPAYAYYLDQRNIFVLQSDGSATLWYADPNSWKQRACATAGRSLTEEEWERFLPDRPYEPACAP